MSRLQRIILAIGFTLTVVVIAYLLYAVFFRPLQPAGPGAGPGVAPGANLPTAGGNANIPQLVNGTGRLPVEGGPTPTPAVTPTGGPATVSPVAAGGTTAVTTVLTSAQQLTADADGRSLLYYNPDDGRFYRLGPDGRSTPLSDRVFHQVQTITWSEDRRRAVLEYPDGANIIYDFRLNRQYTLPTHWEGFDFSPDGAELVAKSIGRDPESRWLVVSDATGARVRPITALGEAANAVITDWSPNGQMVAMLPQNDGLDRQQLLFIGLGNENFPSTQVPGWGFTGRWTPDGNRLLYSVHNAQTGGRPELWLVDASPSSVGTNRQATGLQTWADKCVFASATVAYCAVPERLPDAAGLFPNETDVDADNLYRVDLSSGASTLVALPELRHTMRSLVVGGDGRALYYTARQDSKVYRIQLK